MRELTAGDVGRIGESRERYFNDWTRRAAQAKRDGRKVQREAARECKFCFYANNRISGQAFTEYTCAHCGELRSYPNTGVPTLCEACADKLGACIRCGGSREWAGVNYRSRQ